MSEVDDYGNIVCPACEARIVLRYDDSFTAGPMRCGACAAVFSIDERTALVANARSNAAQAESRRITRGLSF